MMVMIMISQRSVIEMMINKYDDDDDDSDTDDADNHVNYEILNFLWCKHFFALLHFYLILSY